jgi:hypothetical protein
VYDKEPYAHMLDIRSVFQDIQATLSDAEHVPRVCVNEPPPEPMLLSKAMEKLTHPLIARDNTSMTDSVPVSKPRYLKKTLFPDWCFKKLANNKNSLTSMMLYATYILSIYLMKKRKDKHRTVMRARELLGFLLEYVNFL